MTRRGAVLLVVMGIVVLGALVAAAVLTAARSRATGAALAERHAQSRLLAWSGVVAVMGELQAQRDRLVRGEDPALTGSWVAYEVGERRAVIRLVAFEDGAPAVSEGAKLDVNTATGAMLSRVEPLASGEVDVEGQRPLDAVEDVTGLPEGAGAWLTTFGFDAEARAITGEPRVEVGGAWTPELAESVARAGGTELAEMLRAAGEGGATLKEPADLVRALARAGLTGDAWITAMDALAVGGPELAVGRVDVHRATAEVLAAIPGIDRGAADRIVQQRGQIDPVRRVSAAWVMVDGILTAEQFAEAARWLTGRSLVWRIRVEAGLTGPEDGVRSGELGELGLQNRTVLEAVIDLSDRRARVAFLRDVTMMEIAGSILAASADDSDTAAEVIEVPAPVDVPAPPRALEPREAPARVSGTPGAAAAEGATSGGRRIGRWRGGRSEIEE